MPGFVKLQRGKTQSELLASANTMFQELYDGLSGAGGGNLYKADKTSLATADADVISQYFTEHSGVTPKKGDVFVIRTFVDSTVYEYSAYIYSEASQWEAMTGQVDAEKVIIREDITLAGNYTQIGNVTKGATETKTLSTKGKDIVNGFIIPITTKKENGAITAQPSVSGFSLSGAGAKEAGTKLTSVTFGTAVLNKGSYKFGPDTGVTVESWSIDRVATPSSLSQTGIVAAASGTDDNAGAGFTLGDQEGSFQSLAYKVTCNHSAGVNSHDNMGDPSDPAVAIAAGSKSQQTSAFTVYRNYFYGTSSAGSLPAVDSDYIRSLTKSNKAYAAGTITINVPAGAKRVTIACIEGKTGVTKVINQTAMNADVTSTFVKTEHVPVEGAEGYTAVNYNVWNFEPPAPYENPAVLVVTLG